LAVGAAAVGGVAAAELLTAAEELLPEKRLQGAMAASR
jgi:hypothetical protein